jgi:hypothetical protein
MGSLCGKEVEMGILILWLLAAILQRWSDAIMDALSCWVLYSFRRGVTDNSLQPRGDDLNLEASSSRENVGSSSKKNLEEYQWRLYFADPSQWWDNREGKINPKAPDFRHKVSKRALWINGWFTPDWVRGRFGVSQKFD